MIDTTELLKAFNLHRGDAIVVPGRAGKHWTRISTRPNLDVTLGDPAMGGRASFSFGLALAQPDRKVVLFDSEGDLLMGLGILPVIAEHQPKNFYHFVLDNECWATTGGQPVPNAKNIDYGMMARGAGYKRTHAFDNIETFTINIARILSEPGPVLAALKIIPEIQNAPIGGRAPWMKRDHIQVLKDLRQELKIAD